jgi:hypothetical protein
MVGPINDLSVVRDCTKTLPCIVSSVLVAFDLSMPQHILSWHVAGPIMMRCCCDHPLLTRFELNGVSDIDHINVGCFFVCPLSGKIQI